MGEQGEATQHRRLSRRRSRRRRRLRRRLAIAAAVFAAALILVAAGRWVLPPLIEAFEGATARSLVVLPLRGGDDATDALVEDVTAELALRSGALVIASGSAFAYAGALIDPDRIASELGVRYALLGSASKAGEQIELELQLIEADGGQRLWYHRFRVGPAELPALRTAITAPVARALGMNEPPTSARLAGREPPHEAEAAALVVRAAASARGAARRERNAQALRLYEAAAALDPESAAALIGATRALLVILINPWGGEPDRSLLLARAEHTLSRALAQAPYDSEAQALRGRLLRLKGQSELAVTALEAVTAADANAATAWAELGRAQIDLGLAQDAVAHLRQALRLSPRDPELGLWQLWLGQAALHTGDAATARDWLQRALATRPDDAGPLPWLAIAEAWLGHDGDARQALDRYRRSRPLPTASSFDAGYPRSNKAVVAQREPMLAALRRLGLPE